MTEQEKNELKDAVIAELKSQGTDVSTATVMTDADGISYVICYDANGNIARVSPDTLNEKSGIDLSWSSSLNLNDIVEGGVYNIEGNRLKTSDNLPINNFGENASFAARLIVTVSPEGATTYRHIVGQTLILSNAEGHETKVYTRSGNRTSYDGGVSYVTTWGVWSMLQGNINVGAVESLDNLIDNGIYSGIYTYGSPETFVMVVINDYDASVKVGQVRRVSQFKYSVYTGTNVVKYLSRVGYGNDGITWDEEGWKPINQDEIKTMVEDAVESILGDIDDDTLDTIKELADKVKKNAEAIDGVKEALADEVEKLKDGDTIVAQAREIHSRNGKTVTDSFLVRTTAGSGTIGDGVATLKSVGGNIVKNLVGDVNDNGWKVALNSCAISTHNGIMTINPTTETFQQVAWGITLDKDFRIAGHKYYYRCNIKSANADNNIFFGVMNYRGLDKRHVVDAASTSEWQALSVIVNANPASVYLGCSICDKRAVLTTLYVKNFYVIDLTEMFGEAKANQMTKEECNRLFGTMDALPQGLSIANPSVFKSTGFNQFNPDMVLVNKAIVDGAIVDGDKTLAIIPCLPCKIGVGENNGYCIHGDFGEDIKVYLTPLNPLEVEGELYLCELTKDTDKGTYVPQIKGYMLVEVPNATDLCVHFLWSEDRGRHDFEPYYESKVELPTIPEMSEYGLAGIQSSGTLVCDEIDFEKGVYRKKIGAVDMGSLTWSVNTLGDRFVSSAVPGLSDKGYSKINNIICELYTTRRSTDAESTFREDANKRIFVESYWGSVIIVVDSAYTDAAALKESLQGVMLYYELAEPIEYPLPKVANNYTSSDYGVEQFDGAVPCNTNNLYYMRSLAGETRNFLDRMYANTGKRESPIAVADYITTNIAENKAKAEEAPNLALRALFIAAGAEYNEETGYYTVGDLNDVTESQMLAIFNYKDAVTNLFLDRYPGNANIRCIIPSANIYAYGQMYPTGRPLAGNGMFTNSDIEVFKLYKNQDINSVNTINIPYISNNLYGAFNHCKKLKVIYPINVSLVTNSSRLKDLVVGCTELAEVRLFNIKASCSLSDSPLVSKDSIMYMIQNAAPTSAITITLHADAYARLKDDADIVAALAAQPLVTLVSA